MFSIFEKGQKKGNVLKYKGNGILKEKMSRRSWRGVEVRLQLEMISPEGGAEKMKMKLQFSLNVWRQEGRELLLKGLSCLCEGAFQLEKGEIKGRLDQNN